MRSVILFALICLAFAACEGAASPPTDHEFAPTADPADSTADFDFVEPMEIVVSDNTEWSVAAEICHADPNKVIFGRSFSCTVPATGTVYQAGDVVESMFVQFMVPGTVTVTSELESGKPRSWTITDDAFICSDTMPGVPANPSDYPTLWPSIEIPVVCGEGAYTVIVSNDVDVCAYVKIGNGDLIQNVLAYEFERVGDYDPKLNGKGYADLVLAAHGGEEVTIVVAPIFE